jgi:DNA-binding transcriptional LysR family regulator
MNAVTGDDRAVALWIKDKNNHHCEMNSIEAIKQLHNKGLGIAIMPDITAAKEIDQAI